MKYGTKLYGKIRDFIVTLNNNPFLIKNYLVIYVMIFLTIFFIYCDKLNVRLARWEAANLTLPIASILNEQDFGISDSDVEYFKSIFPNTNIADDYYRLSKHYNRDGQRLGYYFPTYAIICLPYTILFLFLGLPTEYVFVITNMTAFFIFLLVVIKTLDLRKSIPIVLLCTFSPISLSFIAQSAEVVLFSLLGLTVLCWYKNWYKSAAILVSIAGTMNPTVLAVGIVMIIDFLFSIYISSEKGKNVIFVFLVNWKNILIYGCCYIIGLIPFFYFYYNTGLLILTGASKISTMTVHDVLFNFVAYLFDLNFGFFPYYGLLMMSTLILAVIHAYHKNFYFFKYISAFLLTVMSYSIMYHINHGMTAISRYNSWCSVLLIFIAVFMMDSLKRNNLMNTIHKISGYFTACWIAFLFLHGYRIDMPYVYMTPIAEFVLDNAPCMYNPLHSTFNSRVNHVDGGYSYELPIIYSNKNGIIKKILADSSCMEYLLNSVMGNEDEIKWLTNELSDFSSEAYISIPRTFSLKQCHPYDIGSTIFFYGDEANAEEYIQYGFSHQENSFTWTEGNECCISFKTTAPSNLLHAKINIASIFNKSQHVIIYSNGDIVYDDVVVDSPAIEFDFKNGKNIGNEIKIVLPDAVSPAELNMSTDSRILGLAIQTICITEK